MGVRKFQTAICGIVEMRSCYIKSLPRACTYTRARVHSARRSYKVCRFDAGPRTLNRPSARVQSFFLFHAKISLAGRLLVRVARKLTHVAYQRTTHAVVSHVVVARRYTVFRAYVTNPNTVYGCSRNRLCTIELLSDSEYNVYWFYNDFRSVNTFSLPYLRHTYDFHRAYVDMRVGH